MKKLTFTFVALGFLLLSVPVVSFAETTPTPTPTPTPTTAQQPDAKTIKSQLLKVKQKQAITKAKIKKDILKTKTTIKKVKQARAKVKIQKKNKRIYHFLKQRKEN